MTTTKCDICGIDLEFNHRNPTEIKGKAELFRANASAVEIRDFTYSLNVESFQFNCTNFHICLTCLVDAVAKSVERIARPVQGMVESQPA